MYTKSPKINERSESFNENRLIAQLTNESDNANSTKETTEFFYRRDSCNEKYLSDMRNEGNDKFQGANGVTSDEVGSPFVSMPAIPAVYLAENGESQPLEKVSSNEKCDQKETKFFYLNQFGQMIFPVGIIFNEKSV